MPISNPASVREIATGTYTGDGTTARQIVTGFKCSAAIIIDEEDAANLTEIIVLPDAALAQYGGADKDVNAFALLHATDGFVVGNNADDQKYYGNKNLHAYAYWAISE